MNWTGVRISTVFENCYLRTYMTFPIKLGVAIMTTWSRSKISISRPNNHFECLAVHLLLCTSRELILLKYLTAEQLVVLLGKFSCSVVGFVEYRCLQRTQWDSFFIMVFAIKSASVQPILISRALQLLHAFSSSNQVKLYYMNRDA